MTKTVDVSWLLTGAGDVCERKSGAPLYQLPGQRLLALYRRNREAGEDFARRHGPSRYVDSLSGLLATEAANALYVATPPQRHLEECVAGARAGLHILVEKPMAMHSGEALQMVQACKAAGVTLAVAYYRRCYPSVLRAKSLLASGTLGKLNEIWINTQFPPSHRLDLMHFFGGDIASVRLDADGETLIGSFVEGGHLRMKLGWGEEGVPEQIRIQGEAGELWIDDLKGGSLICLGEREEFAPLPWTHWGLIENFGLHLAGEAELACSGEEGLKSTVLLDIVSTLSAGGEPMVVDYLNPPDPDWMKAEGFHLLG